MNKVAAQEVALIAPKFPVNGSLTGKPAKTGWLALLSSLLVGVSRSRSPRKEEEETNHGKGKNKMEAKEKGETLPTMESSSSMPPPLHLLASRIGPTPSFLAVSPDVFISSDPRRRLAHGEVPPPADPRLRLLPWPLRPTHGLLFARIRRPGITAVGNSSQATQIIHSALCRIGNFHDA